MTLSLSRSLGRRLTSAPHTCRLPLFHSLISPRLMSRCGCGEYQTASKYHVPHHRKSRNAYLSLLVGSGIPRRGKFQIRERWLFI